jgi:uncharacterized membrane protein YfcA
MEDLLDRLFAQQWVLGVVVLALLLVAGALGGRLGRRLSSTVDEAHNNLRATRVFARTENRGGDR